MTEIEKEIYELMQKEEESQETGEYDEQFKDIFAKVEEKDKFTREDIDALIGEIKMLKPRLTQVKDEEFEIISPHLRRLEQQNRLEQDW